MKKIELIFLNLIVVFCLFLISCCFEVPATCCWGCWGVFVDLGGGGTWRGQYSEAEIEVEIHDDWRHPVFKQRSGYFNLIEHVTVREGEFGAIMWDLRIKEDYKTNFLVYGVNPDGDIFYELVPPRKLELDIGYSVEVGPDKAYFKIVKSGDEYKILR